MRATGQRRRTMAMGQYWPRMMAENNDVDGIQSLLIFKHFPSIFVDWLHQFLWECCSCYMWPVADGRRAIGRNETNKFIKRFQSCTNRALTLTCQSQRWRRTLYSAAQHSKAATDMSTFSFAERMEFIIRDSLGMRDVLRSQLHIIIKIIFAVARPTSMSSCELWQEENPLSIQNHSICDASRHTSES